MIKSTTECPICGEFFTEEQTNILEIGGTITCEKCEESFCLEERVKKMSTDEANVVIVEGMTKLLIHLVRAGLEVEIRDGNLVVINGPLSCEVTRMFQGISKEQEAVFKRAIAEVFELDKAEPKSNLAN